MTTGTNTFQELGTTVCRYCAEEWEPNDQEREQTSMQVYRCQSCEDTFCDGCTDLQYWKNSHPRSCPHCGAAP